MFEVYSLWNYPQMNATGPYWWKFNIGSHLWPMLTQIYVAMWRCHQATMTQSFMQHVNIQPLEKETKLMNILSTEVCILHRGKQHGWWCFDNTRSQSISSTRPTNYRKTSCISRPKSPNLNVSCILLQLSSLNPLKPGVKLRMKM